MFGINAIFNKDRNIYMKELMDEKINREDSNN